MNAVKHGDFNGNIIIIIIIMVIKIIIIIIINIVIFIVMIFKWRYNNCGRKRKERSANYGIYYRSDES
jgi:heme/copper-type cytochrome/quinol oxidase subunit 2